MTPFVEIAQSRYKSRVGLLLAVSRVPSCGRKGRTGFYASHCNVFGAEGRRGAGGAGGGAGYGRTTPCAVSSSCRDIGFVGRAWKKTTSVFGRK